MPRKQLDRLREAVERKKKEAKTASSLIRRPGADRWFPPSSPAVWSLAVRRTPAACAQRTRGRARRRPTSGAREATAMSDPTDPSQPAACRRELNPDRPATSPSEAFIAAAMPECYVVSVIDVPAFPNLDRRRMLLTCEWPLPGATARSPCCSRER